LKHEREEHIRHTLILQSYIHMPEINIQFFEFS
jgi:hypothetical protein